MRERGQATAEYVGVVFVVAAALAVVTAIGAPWLPGTIVERLEQAICVVGLDVCDADQARAEGLEPCVTASTDARAAASATVMSVKFGDGSSVQIEERSDGTVLLRSGRENEGGVTAGFGFGFKKVPGAEVGGSATASLTFKRGRTLVTDRAGLALLRDRLKVTENPNWGAIFVDMFAEEAPRDRVTDYAELEGRAGLDASIALGGKDAAWSGSGGSAGVRAAVGRSSSRGVTTYYYDVGATADGPLASVLPDAKDRRVAVAWQRSEPPVLTVTAVDAASDGRRSETVSRMVLSTTADRDAASRWVLRGGQIGDAAGRALAARMGSAAVQRFTYAEHEDDKGSFEIAGKLGVEGALGVDETLLRRRLVDAQVLNRPIGGKRLDCLSSTAR